MRELVDRLAEQSDNLYRLEEVHETARNQLNELGEVHTQEISKHASQVESVTDKLAEFNNRLDAALLIRAERTELTTVRAVPVPVPLSTCPVIDDSKLKSQNAFLQQKITNLEGKFSALVQESDKSNDAAMTTGGDTSITLGGLKCSPSQVENIVTNEWNKNIEIYRKFNPVITCPVTPILPPTIVEKFVEKIVIKNVVKIVEKNLTTVVYRPAVAATPVILSPDYARKQAGSEIIHESSSHTYTPREMDFGHVSQNILNYLGVNSNSFLVENPLSVQIRTIAESVAPSFVHLLGMDNKIGKPEDAISTDISLGSCWPMEVKKNRIIYLFIYLFIYFYKEFVGCVLLHYLFLESF